MNNHTHLRTFWRSLFCFALLGATHVFAAFTHPGGLHTQADLDRMKAHVAAGDHPWIDSWNALLLDPKAQSTYNPAPQANMGASRQRASADAVAAYLNAIRGYVADSTAHTDNAIRICNLWSAAVNQVPSGTDQPGLSGLYCYQFAVVGEILRIHVGTRWAQADYDRFQAMMRTYLYPICHDFLVRHNNACISHYWANWDSANIAALAAIGVFCDDQAIFDEAVDYFKNGAGNGAIMHAVAFRYPGDTSYGLGQWQETGRDQEHNALGVGLLSTFCQIAWNQGVDMFSYDNNRLLAGAEYVARFELWQNVPYTTYNNCDDVNQYWASNSERGRLQRPIWELLYNHYVVQQGLNAPGVTLIASLNRPEAYTHDDHFGYGSLAYTLDAAASPYPPFPAPGVPTTLTSEAGVGRVFLSWDQVPAANGYVIRRATVSGGPYTTVATYRGAIPRYYDTSITNGTTYYYRVAASNQAGTSGDSAEVSATPIAATPTLPVGWSRRDLGTFAAAGSASFGNAAGGTFFVSGSGAGIGGTADGISYTFGAVNGDAMITARLIGGNTSGAGGSGKFGVMFRESLSPDAKTEALVVGDEGFRVARFGTRSSTGGAMTFINGNAYTGPSQEGSWFRIQRIGDTFTAYQSGDGVTWYQVGSTTAVMSPNVLVGFAVGAASASVITGNYDHVTVSGTWMPAPPANLTAINGHGQVTLTWGSSAGATSYDLKRGATSGGPYTTIATGLTGNNYVDTGLADGTAVYYVITARQDTYESVNSNEAVGTPGDINSVWSGSPSSGNWSVGANWIGGLPPENGASLAFNTSSVTTLTNDLAGFSTSRVTFNAGASAFTVSGNTFTLSGSIDNGSSSAQTFSLPIGLSGAVAINATAGAVSISGILSNAGSAGGLIKNGAQPLSLTGLNTFTGDTQLNTGTLSIAGIGTGTSGSPTAGALGRGTVALGGGTLTESAAATIYNNLIVQAGTTTNITSAVANLTLAGNLSGSGAINETGGNVGGTHLAGDNSGFTGTFTSANATNHRVRFNSANAGSANATWVLNNSQTDGYGLNFGVGTLSFGALSGSGTFRNDWAAGGVSTLSIGALNTDTSFSGLLVSNGNRAIGVTKVGSGRLIFTNANTYDGPTIVNAGTLLINGSIRSAVTVNAGTFGGSGSSTAAITVNAGGAFTPGNLSVGAFATTAAVTFNAGATYRVELNSSLPAADKLTAAGVTLNGATLDLTDAAPTALPGGTRFTIIDNTSQTPVTGTFAGLPEGTMLTVGANNFRITYVGGDGNDVQLSSVAQATITLGNLSQTYDGTPRSVSTTTSPANVPVQITYAGSPTPPTDAGIYAITATVASPDYQGSTTGSLVVAKATATVTLGSLSYTYDGSAKTATATTVPSGLSTTISYNGSLTAPTNAGSYTVVSSVNDANYAGVGSGTLVIAPASATIALSQLVQKYDGTPKSAVATTTPANLPVSLTYDGSASAPVYPGVHAVVATITDPNYTGTANGSLVISTTALVVHAPNVNGWFDGSLQVLNGEAMALNNGSTVTGDLLVPGSPAVQINGQPVFGGTTDGPGSAVPTNYSVTLNNGSVLRHLVRRIDPVTMPSVAAPPAPTGTRDIAAGSTASIGDFTTLRNLTVRSSSAPITIPPGTYGAFTVNGPAAIILGTAGATEPSLYQLQSLTVNSNGQIRVVGPVILTIANGFTLNGTAGSSSNATWLQVRIAVGSVAINGQATLNGSLTAPSSAVSINGTVHGVVTSSALTINSGGSLIDP